MLNPKNTNQNNDSEEAAQRDSQGTQQPEGKAYSSGGDCIRLLAENLRSAILIIDIGTAKIIDANQPASKFYGYSYDSLTRMRYHDLVILPPEEIWDCMRKISTGKISSMHLFARMANGAIREVEVDFCIYQVQEKTICFAILQDVAINRQEETSKAEMFERYYSLFEQSHDGVFILDLNGYHIEVNHHAANMLGYSSEEMIGMSVYEISAEIEKSLDVLHKLTSGEHIPLLERKFKKKNGEIIDVELNVELVRDANGKPLHIQSVVRDISERKKTTQVLNISEELKRAALNSIGAHIAVVDNDGNIIEVNAPWLNFAKENGITDPDHTVVNVNYLDVLRRAIQSGDVKVNAHLYGILGVLNGTLAMYEADYPCDTPTIAYWFAMKVLPLSKSGRGAIIVHENITERKQAELVIRESEERFSKAFHTSLDPISISRLSDGVYIDVNHAFCQMFDVTREQVVGHTAAELGVWDDDLHKNKFIQTIQKNGFADGFEFEYHNKKGKTGNILASGNLINLGNEECLLVVRRDITDLKLSEQKLRESDNRFKQAFLSSPIGISIVNLSDGHFYDVNDVFLDLIEYSRVEVIGRTASEINLISNHDVIQNWMQILSETEYLKNIETSIRSKSGKIRHLMISGRSLEMNGDKLSMLLMVDITARKNAEAALLTARDELEHRVHERTIELRTTNENLERALRAKDEFMAAMSHELRTPLNAIIGLSQSLQMSVYGDLSEKQGGLISMIELNGERLLGMVVDILDYSRLQNGDFTASIALCELSTICRAAISTITNKAASKGQSCDFRIQPEGIVFQTDGRVLVRILSYLLENASKFAPNNSQFGIIAAVDPTGDLVVITVWDEGMGIKNEDYLRSFEPFVQLDSGLARRYGGTGLGLTLAKKFTELLGGTLHISSIVGKGSHVTVNLPWKK